MHYSTIAAPLVLAAGAMAHSNGTVYVTEVVSSFTTYCPYATTFSHGASTYTVTEATTLTITNCPCTITKPVVAPSAAPIATSAPSASSVPVSPVKPAASPFTGAGNRVAASGAGLAALLGLAAYLL